MSAAARVEVLLDPRTGWHVPHHTRGCVNGPACHPRYPGEAIVRAVCENA